MKLEAVINKWNTRIDEYMKDHRLKLLLELSDKAQTLILESRLSYGSYNFFGSECYSLFFQGKHFNWELRVTSKREEDTITIKRRRNILFEWIAEEQIRTYTVAEQYTEKDLFLISELIYPVISTIKLAVEEILDIDKLDNDEQLKSTFVNLTVVDIIKDNLGRSNLLLSNGTKILVSEQLREIEMKKEKEFIDWERQFVKKEG